MLLVSLLQAQAANIDWPVFAKIAAASAAALIVFGAAKAIAKIGSSSMDAIARQPEAADKVRMSMIIIGALVEGVALFAIIICLLVAL